MTRLRGEDRPATGPKPREWSRLSRPHGRDALLRVRTIQGKGKTSEHWENGRLARSRARAKEQGKPERPPARAQQRIENVRHATLLFRAEGVNVRASGAGQERVMTRKNKMHISKFIRSGLMCACAFLSVAICPQVLALDKLKTFDSLFGFKAGEDRAKIKLKKSSLDDRYFRARKPFRQFRDVQLTYNDNGKLRGISAVAWIDGMKKFDAVKKEVEACCKEFSVFGITFREKQENDPDVSAYGRGPGIEGMDIRGSVGRRYDERGVARVGASLSIAFNWNLDFKPINVKVANYSAKFGISRKDFVEKTFGMKFGESIVKYIELKDEDKVRLSESDNESGNNVYEVYRYMSSRICGFKDVIVHLDKPSMRIKRICFADSVQVKDRATAKARFENARAALGKWLGIDSFDTKEDEKSSESTFEDNGLRVTIRDFVMENKRAKQAGWSSSIDVDIEQTTGTEARMRE